MGGYKDRSLLDRFKRMQKDNITSPIRVYSRPFVSGAVFSTNKITAVSGRFLYVDPPLQSAEPMASGRCHTRTRCSLALKA